MIPLGTPSRIPEDPPDPTLRTTVIICEKRTSYSSCPLALQFMTPLSVYRENASNHWETVWIMFSFFSNFHSVERYFLASPALNHSATSPFIPKLFLFFFLFPVLCQARPPSLSVTFRVFQKSFSLFMRWTRISCCPIQSLVGGSRENRRCIITFVWWLWFESVRPRKEFANTNSKFALIVNYDVHIVVVSHVYV